MCFNQIPPIFFVVLGKVFYGFLSPDQRKDDPMTRSVGQADLRSGSGEHLALECHCSRGLGTQRRPLKRRFKEEGRHGTYEIPGKKGSA